MSLVTNAYTFSPKVVRSVVSRRSPGAYALGTVANGFIAGYVGRSDRCLQDRLASHELLGMYDYFLFRVTSTPETAYFAECELWHACKDLRVPLENRVHPATPRGLPSICPYCDFARRAARLIMAA